MRFRVSGARAREVALALMVLVRSLASIYGAELIGTGRADVVIGAELGGKLAEIALALVGVILFDLGPIWVAFALVMNWAGQLFFLRRRSIKARFVGNLQSAILSVIRQSWPYATLGVAVTYNMQAALLIAPIHLQPVGALGSIGLAVSVIAAGNGLIASVLSGMTQSIAQSARDGTSFTLRVFSSGMILALFAGVMAYVILHFAGRQLIVPVLGEEYRGMADLALPIGCLVAALSALTVVSSIHGYYENVAIASVCCAGGIIATNILAWWSRADDSAAAVLYSAAGGAAIAVLFLAILFLAARRGTAPRRT